MLTEKERTDIVNTTQVVGYSLSLSAASIVVLIILITMYLDRKLMDRVSIRFTLAISLVDIIIASSTLREYVKETKGVSCVFVDSLIFFCSQFYVFLYAAIAFNLQLVFINGVRIKPRMELYYWLVVVIIPLFLTIINAMVSDFNSCYKKDELGPKANDDTQEIEKEIDPLNVRVKDFAMEWGLNYGWSFFLCLYCVVIFIVIIFKLSDNERKLSRVMSNKDGSWQSMRYNSAISKIIYRIALYCIIPIIFSCSIYVSSIYYLITGKETFPIILCTRLSEGLPGTLNLIVFVCDPVFPQALHAIYQHLSNCLTFRHHRHTRSHCSAIPLELPSSSRASSLYDPHHPSTSPCDLSAPPPITESPNPPHHPAYRHHRPTASIQSFVKCL